MTASAEPGPAKPKRRWLQFSLRTLLVLVLLVAVFCGWLRHKVNQSEQERRAVAAIVAMGGNVEYGHEKGGLADPPGPPWLRAVLGNYFFADVDTVNYPPGVGDESLVHLDGLRHLKQLHLRGTSVTDAGLVHVTRHPELVMLELGSTSITDSGIKQLERLPNLTHLYLKHSAITDQAVETLIRFDRLEHVGLGGTLVTAEGFRKMNATLPAEGVTMPWLRAPSEKDRRIAVALERRGAYVQQFREHEQADTEYWVLLVSPRWRGDPADLADLTRLDHFWGISLRYVELNDKLVEALRGLSNLRNLCVGLTPVTHTQWVQLTRGKSPGERPGESNPEGLSNLQGLYLSGVPITDADLGLITGWRNLRTVRLEQTPITDAGMVHLGGLTDLTELSLADTQITDAGLGHLKSLQNLQSLDLSYTQVTDAGLVPLEGLKKLKYLDLTGIQFGPQGTANRARLEKALPEVEIVGP